MNSSTIQDTIHRFLLTGIVKEGQKRGRILGYPTANIPYHSTLPEGIYISTTKIANKEYQSVTFIGASQTFGETGVQCETFILDFSGDLYGKEIAVCILQKIRENKKFKSADALVRQIEKDVYIAKNYFVAQKMHHMSSPK